jgi:hypothetical protein
MNYRLQKQAATVAPQKNSTGLVLRLLCCCDFPIISSLIHLEVIDLAFVPWVEHSVARKRQLSAPPAAA